MLAGHSHSHPHARAGGRRTAQIDRVLLVVTVACAIATVVGLVALWPGDRAGGADPLLLDAEPVAAEVQSEAIAACTYDPAAQCRAYVVEIREGSDRGTVFEWEQGASSTLRAGDDILVIGAEAADGTVTYSFYEHQRTTPLIVLGALFVVAVLVLGRLRGVGSLAGLAASLAVVIVFMIPSLLDGNDAVVVALVAAATVAFIAVYLAHGLTMASTVALLSTFASLALTAVLAQLFVSAGKLTGLTEDASFLLGALDVPIDPRGILLAGVVIGSLGVLDDVTVTQVSTVGALRAADPGASTRRLYSSALGVGRDHISSTVNTLFLAYVGAALPLLLLFTEASQSIGAVATRELVATEIVRALVGSIGLVASVPIATGLAAMVYRPADIRHRNRA
jgi:uncharacterized membrane protein